LTESANIAIIGESARLGVAVKTVSATEIKNRLGQYLGRVAVEPVAIEKNGRPVAVLLSFEEYEVLRRSDDAFWGEAARAAEAEGFLSVEDSLRRLQDAPASEDRATS
jgi:prevent-host-death family protein